MARRNPVAPHERLQLREGGECEPLLPGGVRGLGPHEAATERNPVAALVQVAPALQVLARRAPQARQGRH